MKLNYFLFCALMCLLNLKMVMGTKKVVVCYFLSTSGVKAIDLNPNLCTHLNYAFITFNNIDGKLNIQEGQVNLKLLKDVINMKKVNKDLKILFSIGGVEKTIYSKMVENKTMKQNFINSAKYYLDYYGVDGLDFDWEYPEAKDKTNFVTFVKEVKEAFSKNGWLITAAFNPYPRNGYDIKNLSLTLDLMNIMCYNYNGAWANFTGQNSPLRESPIDSPYHKKFLNVVVTIKNWINEGADPKKLVMGIPFYGRTFTLKDPNNHALHAPAVGPGKVVSPTYFYIMNNFGNWTTIWDDDQKSPIKYFEDEWLGYDDTRTVTLKADFAKANNLAGVMIWHVGGDDLRGIYGPKQTLLTTINKVLNG